MALTNYLFVGWLCASFCIAPAAAADGDEFRLLEIDGHHVKWGVQQPGTGATITYAVASHRSAVSGIVNCRKTAPIDSLLKQSKIGRSAFREALITAFRMWSDVSGVRFEPSRPGTSANIIIAAEDVPDGIAYSDVTPSSTFGTGFVRPMQAVICLNPAAAWTAAEKTDSGDAYRLFYVLAHEIGHVIGLDHPNPSGALMSFEYSRTLQSLQPGDVSGAVLLYGEAKRTHIASHSPR